MTNVVVCGADFVVDDVLGLRNKEAGTAVAVEGIRRRICVDNQVIVRDQGEADRHFSFIDTGDPVYGGRYGSQRPSGRAPVKLTVFAGGGHCQAVPSQCIPRSLRKRRRNALGVFSFEHTLR